MRQGRLHFEHRPAVGAQLELGAKYFLQACDILSEVGLKLGQTLWRKVFPDELAKADEELNAAIYDVLYIERYSLAQIFGEFAVQQKVVSSEIFRRLYAVNLAIALKSNGRSGEANKVLNKLDWSACSLDFRLAHAVLRDRTSDACRIMKNIGKRGEFVKEESYHVWPLFSKFRLSPEFLKTYEEIYGRRFVVELQKEADKKRETLTASARKTSRGKIRQRKPGKRSAATRDGAIPES